MITIYTTACANININKQFIGFPQQYMNDYNADFYIGIYECQSIKKHSKLLKVIKPFIGNDYKVIIKNLLKFKININRGLFKILSIISELYYSNTKGIVFISGIEEQLHPHHQQLIIPLLDKLFPHINFIITTLSPQVLSTVRKENIRVIESIGDCIYKTSIPEFSPLSHPSSDALALIMDVSPAPNLFEGDLGQYEQYIKHNQENIEEAIIIRKRLDDAGYEFNESDLSKWRFIANRKKINRV